MYGIYQNRKVVLDKIMNAPELTNKQYKVYTKSNGKIIKIGFGDRNSKIRRKNLKAKKSFRARHRCDSDKPKKTTPRYWSCKMWE